MSESTAPSSSKVNEASGSVPICTRASAPTKMPLTARKDYRDNFEAKKPEYEKFFSDTLGGDWKIIVDANAVYSYTLTEGYNDTRGSFGRYVSDYFSASSQEGLRDFLREFGDDGKTQLLNLAHNKTITLEPGKPSGYDQEYGTCAFDNGVWRFIFHEDHFGSNARQVMRHIGARVAEAEARAPAPGDTTTTPTTSTGPPKLSLVARKDIRDNYDAAILAVLDRARKYLQTPTLAFAPNFELNYALLQAWARELAASPDERDIARLDRDWEARFGRAALAYFVAFADYLRDEGFHRDEMLREGWQEAVTAGRVEVRIAREEEIRARAGEGAYSDAVVEEGVLVLRTSLEYWGKNCQYASKGIMDLL